MPWEQNFLNQQGQDQDEHGRVCQFEVENIHATQWQFDESFRCGNSTKRIVMCQKAFEVFEKVDKNSQHSKGQIISECPYEIIVSPIRATKKFLRFLPGL